VKAHPSQEASMFILKKINGLDKMKETYQLLDASVREGRMKPCYDQWVKILEEELEAEAQEKEAQKKQAKGLDAPLFTLNDLNGKPLALTSLRGKYVILDFWGSWCVWCIKGFPKMKEYYAKYPGKFEILGVDCNDTEDKWRAAVKKHELPWLHVYCPSSSTLLTDYGVTGFPTKIIIGPDGKIVKSIVGEDPAFYTLLDELFGK
jgi:thiol-disulfide isomerase/thioredoxin